MKNNDIYSYEINGVSFKLRELRDISFLSQLGQVFCVFDQNDSGNISFGLTDKVGKSYFIKLAGVKTLYMSQTVEESVVNLKEAAKVYGDITGVNTIPLIDSGTIEGLFYLMFEWKKGECLFDHWNFDYYEAHPEVKTPKERFQQLDKKYQYQVCNQLIDFFMKVEVEGYIAVDFYDSSLMYDFEQHQLMICDLDLYLKQPVSNQIGKDFWGSKRVKSPEEYQLGARLDHRTNVFKLGAVLFHLFGRYTSDELSEMYRRNKFLPCCQSNWELDDSLYDVCIKATAENPNDRFQCIEDYTLDWTEIGQ